MNTVIEMFEHTVAQYPNHNFILEYQGQGYQGMTFSEVHSTVLKLSQGLIEMGIQPGDRVAILSENRAEWMLADLAIIYAGAIVVTLSAKLIEGQDLLVRLQNSGAETIFVSKAQLPKIERLKAQTSLKHIICFDDKTYRDLLQRGQQTTPNTRIIQPEPSTPALIIYTSGTTGMPKGVVLSHRACVAHTIKHQRIGDFRPDSCTLALLPLDHCLFHSFFYQALADGAAIAIPKQGNSPLETMLHLTKNIQEVHPDTLIVVPALLQTFKVLLTQQHIDGDIEAVRRFFGGRLRYFIAGGALTDAETETFFMNLGLPIHIGYGMTEVTAGISRSCPEQHRTGSVGRPATLQQDVRIVDEKGQDCPPMNSGEILYRGETLMSGYWHNPEATREVMTEDGWFHTGDLGHLDADGFLFIDGRVKSLLISNSGEKYSPEGIESSILETSPYIQQVMLYNQQSPCTIALVVPAIETIRAALRKKAITLDTEEGQNAAIRLIQDSLNVYRRDGSHAGLFPDLWLPMTFAILDRPFSAQDGLLTATSKLVRHKIAKAYAARIQSLFTPQGMNPLNEANRLAFSKYIVTK